MKLLRIIPLSIFLLLVACNSYPIETNMSEDVQDFEFTTQDNEKLGLSDLEGEWWIADFIFTNCTSVCLPMSYNMSQLQDRLQEEGLDVQLVSFSVDPDFDTPEVLREYGENYDADFSNWTFLTGYEFETIKELSIKSFKSPLIEPPSGSDQVTHGVFFYLISPDHEIIKYYDGVDEYQIDVIINDLKAIKKS